VLAAGCGAPLCVAAVKERDGSVVEDLPAGLQLEVCGEQARTRAITCNDMHTPTRLVRQLDLCAAA